MKPKEAASSLRIKLPSHDQKGSPSISTPASQPADKKLRDVPKLGDIPPLNWKKKTPTTPSKPRSVEGPQGPRSELKKKASAPDVRRRKFHFDGCDVSKSPRPDSHASDLRTKASAPDLRGTKREHVPGIGNCPPLPRHMISSQSLRSQWKNSDADQGPRFMPAAGDDENPSRFSKRSHVGAPRLPTIIGTAPSRMRPKKKAQAKPRESRSKRAMRIMRHPDFRRKWKLAARQLASMKIRKRIHGCARLIRSTAQRRAIDIESKPIYRLREMKRASAMFYLPKIQRLPSMRSIGDLVQVDQVISPESHDKDNNDSDGSVYSDRPEQPREAPIALAPTHHAAPRWSNMVAVNRRDNRRIRRSLLPYRDWIDILESSANPFSDDDSESAVVPLEPSQDPTVNLSEDRSIRASLIPFRDLLLRFESNRNTLNLEDSKDPQLSSPSATFSSYSTLEISSGVNPAPHPPRPLPTLPGDSRLLPGVKSPNNFQSSQPASSIAFSNPTGVMAAPSSSDPFVDSSAEEGKGSTQVEIQVSYPHHELTHNQSDRPVIDSPGENTPTGQTSRPNFPQKDYDAPESQTARPRTDGGLSRIPRVPTQRRHQGLTSSAHKGAVDTPEHHSSIPVSVRTSGAGRSDRRETPDQRFSGGIRMIEKTGGPRRLAAESNPEQEPEPLLPAEGADSSSISSFGCDDPNGFSSQRPTGLTGENRVRPKTRAELLERYGPQLKIASSAERILLGRDDDTSGRQASSPSTQDHGRSVIPAPRYEHINISHSASAHSQLPRDMSGSGLDENTSPGAARNVPNFSRSQFPSENYSRKSDFSGKELDIQRKPASETNLRMERESYDSENIPPVPRIPTMRKSGSTKSVKSNEPNTPPVPPEFYAEMASRVDPFTLAGSLDSHPPRSSSLQVQAGSDFASQSPRDETKDPGITHKASNANIDDIIQEHEQEKQSATESGARLPDSKSTRMLDSFRSIFSKSRTGVDRNPTGKEQPASSTKRARSAVECPDSGKPAHQTSKSRPKWSKSTRSLKSDDISSPIMPLPAPSLLPSPSSYSSFPPPPSSRRQETHTPSFARPTQSTRTRAAASTKQTTVSQEARMHRIKVLTPSTGSPSRTARIQKRSANLAANSTPNARDIHPESDHDRAHPPEKDLPAGAKLADSGRIGIDSVQESIELLCEKICTTDSVPMKRAKYLRLALSLQQQLSDYKGVEKEARDLESLLSQKKGDKGLALNSLIQYLDQVRMQIDED